MKKNIMLVLFFCSFGYASDLLKKEKKVVIRSLVLDDATSLSTTSEMSVVECVQLFEESLPCGMDVLLLQKYPVESSTYWQSFDNVVKKAYPQENFEYCYSQQLLKQTDVHCSGMPYTLYNKEKYERIGSDVKYLEASINGTPRYWEDNRPKMEKGDTISAALLLVVLENKINKNKKVGVINVQMPFVENGCCHKESMMLIKEKVSSSQYDKVTQWIIGGYFNCDMLSEANKKLLKEIFGEKCVCDVEINNKNKAEAIIHFSLHNDPSKKSQYNFRLISYDDHKKTMWTRFIEHIGMHKQYYGPGFGLLVCIVGGYLMKNYSGKV